MRLPVFVHRLLLCALLACATACSKKEGPQATPQVAAQTFFDQIRQGELKPAFENTAFLFQEQQSLKSFIERLREYELPDSVVALSPVTGDPADPKAAKFTAEVTRKSGQKYTLVGTLQQEKNAWRLLSLHWKDPRTGLTQNHFTNVGRNAAISYAAHKKVPDDAEVRQMVHRSMILFSDAIQTETFWEFYENASIAWQKELTEQKLGNAFHSFIDRKVNMNGILEMEPILDKPPEIGSDGYLITTGHYPTKPYEVHFILRFIYELPEWKLLGLNCRLVKVGE